MTQFRKQQVARELRVQPVLVSLSVNSTHNGFGISLNILLLLLLSNAPTTCPCALRGPPSWTWQQCNRLLRLGRP